jgi:hypothetical protein
MEIRNIIRNIIEESLLIEEDKSSIIKKMNQLSRDEQEQLINLFKSKPHLEKKVKDYNIDWNRYKDLKFEDFLPLFEQGSMGAEFKKLKKEKDYIEVLDKDLQKIPGLLGVFIPLNHKAANILAKKAGGNKGQWCIGYDGDDKYWYGYTYGAQNIPNGDDEDSVFFIIITTTDKWAVQVQTTAGNNIKIWDANDSNHGDDNDIVPMVDVRKLVTKHSRLIDAVREELDDRATSDYRYDELKEPKYTDDIEVGDSMVVRVDRISKLETNLKENDIWDNNIEVEVTGIDSDADTVDIEYTAYKTASHDYSGWFTDDGYELETVDTSYTDIFDNPEFQYAEYWCRLTRNNINTDIIVRDEFFEYADNHPESKEMNLMRKNLGLDDGPIKEEFQQWLDDNEDDFKMYLILHGLLENRNQPFYIDSDGTVYAIDSGDMVKDGRYGEPVEVENIEDDNYEYFDYKFKGEVIDIPGWVWVEARW